MWPGSARFQAWLPNQEDVAYSPGLGFGLPLMATMKQQKVMEPSQVGGK